MTRFLEFPLKPALIAGAISSIFISEGLIAFDLNEELVILLDIDNVFIEVETYTGKDGKIWARWPILKCGNTYQTILTFLEKNNLDYKE